MNVLPQSFYRRPTITVAKELLGRLLVHKTKNFIYSGIIVETEAYLADDPACHASGGITPRTKVMFGPPGMSYVYFIYGMYYCLNAVTEKDGTPGAVLIRALEPLDGIELMKKNRKTNLIHNLTAGPGKLTQALKITKKENNLPLYKGRLVICKNDLWKNKYFDIKTAKRIGISKAEHMPLRFYIKANPFVSSTP